MLVFNQLRYRIGLGFNWQTDTVKALLVDSQTWLPDVDDDYVQTALLAGAVEMAGGGYARQTLSTKTVALDDVGDRGLWDGASIDFGVVTGADPYDWLVLYHEVTTDADSWLMAAYALGARVANSTQILFNPDADGYICWPLSCPGS